MPVLLDRVRHRITKILDLENSSTNGICVQNIAQNIFFLVIINVNTIFVVSLYL